jgi:hypothetical protein
MQEDDQNDQIDEEIIFSFETDPIEISLEKLRELKESVDLPQLWTRKREDGRSIRYEFIPVTTKKMSKGAIKKKEEKKEWFKIFPWPIPENKIAMSKEVVEKVQMAMEYFYREGHSFDEEDLSYLRYYMIMSEMVQEGDNEPPNKKRKTQELIEPFFQIIETYRAIKTHRIIRGAYSGTVIVPPPPPPSPRIGSDRAGYLKIRQEDLSSCHLWCRPGEVLGVYPDGVGYLRNKLSMGFGVSNSSLSFSSVIIFSTMPDTVEAHPDPLHRDHYVRYVMVLSSLLSPLRL